jgi:hypothetical protein
MAHVPPEVKPARPSDLSTDPADLICPFAARHFEAGMVGKIWSKPQQGQAMMDTTTQRCAARFAPSALSSWLAAACARPVRAVGTNEGQRWQVWKDLNCGCCKDWMRLFEKTHFRTDLTRWTAPCASRYAAEIGPATGPGWSCDRGVPARSAWLSVPYVWPPGMDGLRVMAAAKTLTRCCTKMAAPPFSKLHLAESFMKSLPWPWPPCWFAFAASPPAAAQTTVWPPPSPWVA